MSTTLFDALCALYARAGVLRDSDLYTASGGSTITVVSTALTEADDAWNGGFVGIKTTTDGLAPQGESREVTDFTASSDTLTVTTAFSVTVGSGDKFVLARAGFVARAVAIRAINAALRWYGRYAHEYTEHDAGDADSNSSDKTKLNDATKAWTTDQWTGCRVYITAGPGVGESRIVSSNTATALTVSPAWTTTHTTATQYAIGGGLDTAADTLEYTLPTSVPANGVQEVWLATQTTEPYAWARLEGWRVDQQSRRLIFDAQPPYAYPLKIVYHACHPDLAVDADAIDPLLNLDAVVEYAYAKAQMEWMGDTGTRDPRESDKLNFALQNAERLKSGAPLPKVMRAPRYAFYGDNATNRHAYMKVKDP